MKILKRIFGIITVILAISFIASCPEAGNDDLGKYMPQGALRALIEPKSIVYDSYAEINTGVLTNYYFIEVGIIRNMYISTLSNIRYNGMTPISYSKTSINETSISQNIKETISKSIKISDTNKKKVDLSLNLEKIPIIGSFIPKASYTWEGTKTKENIETNAIEKSLAEATKQSESETVSYTIGNTGEPAGWHRVALYADYHVYFIVKTSADKQELLGWETVFSVLEDSFYLAQEYSPNGIFDNSPLNDITFDEDFYKYLPDPGIDIIQNIQTDFKSIRDIEKTIKDTGRFNQHADIISFDHFETNINMMKLAGYKTIDFIVKIDAKEEEDGIQYIMLFSSSLPSNDYFLDGVTFEHGGVATKNKGSLSTKWWTYEFDQIKEIPIEKFIVNEFVIRYGASNNKYTTGTNKWQNKNLRVQLHFKQ